MCLTDLVTMLVANEAIRWTEEGTLVGHTVATFGCDDQSMRLDRTLIGKIVPLNLSLTPSLLRLV